MKNTIKNTAPAKSAKPSASKTTTSGGVKAKPDAAQGLQDLFEDELKDIYWAEKALTKALPKMLKNATSQDLKDCITDHIEVTNNQIQRLEDVFLSIGVKAQAKKCEAMAGLIKESEEIMEGTEKGIVRDAGIISAAQKVEHYEIASYGTLKAFATILGLDEAASLLEDTLAEEKEADSTLSNIAESHINLEAINGNSDDESPKGGKASANNSKTAAKSSINVNATKSGSAKSNSANITSKKK